MICWVRFWPWDWFFFLTTQINAGGWKNVFCKMTWKSSLLPSHIQMHRNAWCVWSLINVPGFRLFFFTFSKKSLLLVSNRSTTTSTYPIVLFDFRRFIIKIPVVILGLRKPYHKIAEGDFVLQGGLQCWVSTILFAPKGLSFCSVLSFCSLPCS